MCLKPLNCRLKNDEDGKCYAYFTMGGIKKEKEREKSPASP